jgi:hypothetical protein
MATGKHPNSKFQAANNHGWTQITLRRGIMPLTKEQGVWVFRTGQPLTASVTDAVLHDVRDARDQHNLDPKA